MLDGAAAAAFALFLFAVDEPAGMLINVTDNNENLFERDLNLKNVALDLRIVCDLNQISFLYTKLLSITIRINDIVFSFSHKEYTHF